MVEMQGHLTLIGDDFETKYVTDVLGHLPPYVREKDEVVAKGYTFGHYEWGVSTERIHEYDIPPVCDALMNILKCPTNLLRQVAIDCNAQWNILFLVVVRDRDEFPALCFGADFIKFAAEINAVIGFDTYLYF